MKLYHLVSAALIAAMATTALAQNEPSTAEKVKSWTRVQWVKTRTEFAKDKEKWASCRKQNKDMKLKGKASWAFLYDCMKA
jgi:hypothetical protein